MANDGQDMEFTAQRNGIMAYKSMKPGLEKSSCGSECKYLPL
jgi:hypothetical protein